MQNYTSDAKENDVKTRPGQSGVQWMSRSQVGPPHISALSGAPPTPKQQTTVVATGPLRMRACGGSLHSEPLVRNHVIAS